MGDAVHTSRGMRRNRDLARGPKRTKPSRSETLASSNSAAIGSLGERPETAAFVADQVSWPALLLVVPSGRLWQASGDARSWLGAIASAGPVLTRDQSPGAGRAVVPAIGYPRRDARPGHHVGLLGAAVVRA